MSTEQLISCIALGIALTAFIITCVTAIYVFAYLRKQLTQGIQGPPGPPGPMGPQGKCVSPEPADTTLTETTAVNSDSLRVRKRNVIGQ